MSKICLKYLVFLWVLMLLSSNTFASASSDNKLMISSIKVDIDQSQIIVKGTNFGEKLEKIKTTLAGEVLLIQTVTDTELTVALPNGTLDGDYLFVVAKGEQEDHRFEIKETASYDLTIGAVGPIGATGAQGPVGSQGIQGITGATGKQGPKGSIGPIGFTGATGPQGKTGSRGAAGIQGLTSLADAVGQTGPRGSIGLTGKGLTFTLGGQYITPAVGGAAGRRFSLRCPAGQIAVGLQVRSGDILDAIRLKCRPVTGINVGFGGFTAGVGSLTHTPQAGGNGGGLTDLNCVGNRALNKINGRVGSYFGRTLIKQIRANCQGIMNLASTLVSGTAGNDTTTSTPYSLACPSGKVVTGLVVRAAQYVNQISLICN